ncbi:MAG: hypothetical protein N2Z80_00300 [Hydrogenothermaceae bacterium]|nr:hypothetical protein [Hydrogenothermaceae bacterium]
MNRKNSFFKEKFYSVNEFVNFLQNTNPKATPFILPQEVYSIVTPIRYYRAILDNFLSFPTDKPLKVADIGCAWGHGSLVLSQRNDFEVFGIDSKST